MCFEIIRLIKGWLRDDSTLRQYLSLTYVEIDVITYEAIRVHRARDKINQRITLPLCTLEIEVSTGTNVLPRRLAS